MKRIYVPRAFVVGAIVALLLSGAAATLVTSMKPKVNDAPMTVAAGRVGDRAVYAIYAGGVHAEADWNRLGLVGAGATAIGRDAGGQSGAFESLLLRGIRTFEVDSLVSSLDAAAERHDAVVVVRNLTFGPVGDIVVVEQVDLETRTTFRTDTSLDAVRTPAPGRQAPDGRLPGAQPEAREADGRVQLGQLEVREAALPGIEHQRHALRLGDVLRDESPAIPADLEGVVRDVHLRQWVDSRARIDGLDVYSVRSEVTFSAIPGDVPDPSVSFVMDVAGPLEKTVRAWRVDWVGADRPYAVLREQGIEVDGQEALSHRLTYRLVEYRVGHSLIPWGGHEGDHWAAKRAMIDRTQGPQKHPATGTGSSISFTIEGALARVDAEVATLPAYAAWRRTHPGASLVSASYSTADAPGGLSTARWQFGFADTSGSAHIVIIRRDLKTGMTIAEDGGDVRIQPWAPSDFPANPPTFAAVEAAWADYVSAEARSTTFDYVRWGADLDSRQGDCTTPSMTFRDVDRRADDKRTIDGGHSDDGSCPGTTGDGKNSFIRMDSGSGRTTAAYESEFRHANFRGATVGPDATGRGWSMAGSTIPAGLQAPDPVVAAATTAGFLAVFLAAYFWPVVKFVGARAAFVVGYVKLRKEEILNNPIREHVLTLIRTQPGIHASDIARQANAGWGTIVYHLSVLEKNKVVTSLVDGRHKRFFPADTIDFGKRGQLAALKNPNTRSIYDMIESTPGLVQGELAGKTGLTIPTVIWHLQRLEEAGLVGRDKSGRRFHYFANPVYQPKGAATASNDSMEVQ